MCIYIKNLCVCICLLLAILKRDSQDLHPCCLKSIGKYIFMVLKDCCFLKHKKEPYILILNLDDSITIFFLFFNKID